MYIHTDIHTEREKEEEGWKEMETEKIYQRNLFCYFRDILELLITLPIASSAPRAVGEIRGGFLGDLTIRITVALQMMMDSSQLMMMSKN